MQALTLKVGYIYPGVGARHRTGRHRLKIGIRLYHSLSLTGKKKKEEASVKTNFTMERVFL